MRKGNFGETKETWKDGLDVGVCLPKRVYSFRARESEALLVRGGLRSVMEF